MKMPRFLTLPGGLREQFEGLLAWWLRELRGIGEVLARPAAARPAVIHLQGSTTRAEPVENISDLQPGTRVILSLDAHHALFFEVTFPIAVERELKSAITLYLERELPIRAELVHVHARVKRRDRKLRSIVVEVIAVHRQLLDGLRTRFAQAKLIVTKVGVEAGGELIGDFLPRHPRLDQWRITDLDRRLSAGAAALGLIVVGLIAGQWCYERYQVRDELRRVQTATSEAEALALRFERESEPATDLVALMARPDAADVLATLTARVPDSSWFYELEVLPQRGGALGLKASGFVPMATMFTEILAKTSEFQEVRLISATSAGTGSNRDRVQVTARWGGK